MWNLISKQVYSNYWGEGKDSNKVNGWDQYRSKERLHKAKEKRVSYGLSLDLNRTALFSGVPVANLLFGPWLAALSRARVVSNHVPKPQGHRGVAVVHRHYDDLLVWGALREAGLV